ncbi:DUF2079 domain-containing protein [Leptolyngbya sp. FACHB-17]|uniref:DUF2079 domain-containing protein n=1 Tax=unclassified Leptolyngbya TaxID=2650499 RepID=UPI001F54E761|nr:DUF2079 domain-containing protein [Leptolyngbya sp. FACHB-17]
MGRSIDQGLAGVEMRILKRIVPDRHQVGLRRALMLAIVFFTIVLAISLNRYFSFYTSYDQGLFNQLFWNNLHGRWFQSSLTSANSIASLEDGVTPIVSFIHLGQHVVLTFLLWLPLYALFPHPITLIVLQVGLMTVGGLLLYALARQRLSEQLSVWITASYYTAIPAVGSTVANFYEHCQIPLFTFGTLLALEKKNWLWFWICAVLALGVREDAGIILFGIGVYLMLSRRHPGIGIALCILSFGYVAFVTNVIQPQFSSDVSRLYLANRFRQFVDTDQPTTLQVLWGMVTHPLRLAQYLLLPIDRRINYLAGQWAALALVPAVSGAAWILSAFPLIAIFAQTGQTALSVTLRYAVAVVPGVFYGAILWWERHPHWFTAKFRRWWKVCIVLSLLFMVSGNPHRAFSFMIPDSVRPWVFVPLPRQWEHASHIYNVIRNVPDNVSVSTTTYLVPQLSTRRIIVRLPTLEIYDDRRQKVRVDYAIADLWQLKEYSKAFKDSQAYLARTLPLLEKLVNENQYGVRQVEDGVVMMVQGQPSDPAILAQWQKLVLQLKQG